MTLRVLRKVCKRIAWATSWFVKLLTIMRWTGLALGLSLLREFEPNYFRGQGIYKAHAPCAHGEKLWNIRPVDDFIKRHIRIVRATCLPKAMMSLMRREGLVYFGSFDSKKH